MNIETGGRFAFPKAFEVGCEAIDAQHREIADKISDLRRFAGVAREDGIGRYIDELLEMVRAHFRDEENIMREAKFDKLQEHISNHNKYLKLFISKCQIIINNSKITYDDVSDLFYYFVEDVSKADLLFQEFLNEMRGR